jgi:UDP-3-O-[3-hydroxymyristoyl] glucosamine N-acyltransferase
LGQVFNNLDLMIKDLFFKKNKKFLLLKDIFFICNSSKIKYPNKKILGLNNLKDSKFTEITFFDSLIYLKDAESTKAFACIVNIKMQKYLNKNTIPIISKNPLIDFYKIVSLFYPESINDNEKINFISFNKLKKFFNKSIFFGNNCLVEKTVKIGNNTKIGNNVLIKKGVYIGKNCLIGSNVIIENSLIGDNVVIKSGTLIGQTGFGFKFINKKKFKLPHIGRVIIENDVQIGSLCTVDRGSLGDTVIGEFSSIDNQVQIAHNVKIGNYCMVAAQVGIAGSTIIGNHVKIGGQAGLSGHLRIGNNVKIGGKSGVISDIEENNVVMGYPAKNIREFVKTR